jgi:hypothetical protein
MSEITSCPSCQRKLQVPETLIGQDVQCPTCGATFVARLGGDSAPAPARPEARPWDFERHGRERGNEARFGPPDEYAEPGGWRRRDLAPHRGVLILVLGILGLVVLPILSPVAWIMGNTDMAEIRAGRMDPDGESLTQVGRVCGIIGTVLMVLVMCFIGLACFGMLSAGLH